MTYTGCKEKIFRTSHKKLERVRQHVFTENQKTDRC